MLDLALPEVWGHRVGGGVMKYPNERKIKGSILAVSTENILKSDVSQSNIKLIK